MPERCRSVSLLLCIICFAGLLARFVLLALAGSPTGLPVDSLPVPPSQEYQPGEVIIKFVPGAARGEKETIRVDLGATRLREFRVLGASCERIERLTVSDAIRRYRDHPLIAYIEPNFRIDLCETPDDPHFDQQWSLRNSGQTGGLAGADVRAIHAWDVATTASSVVVAVIDTGMDLTHPDLINNLYWHPGEIPDNGLDDDGNGYVDDVHGWNFQAGHNNPQDLDGHGTAIAGIIGAVGDNAQGVVGVCWDVQILPVRWAAGSSGTLSNLVASIVYAIEMGADILNCSFGRYVDASLLREAFVLADSLDILAVCAAGNGGHDLDAAQPFFPASYGFANIVSVAASDEDDELAWFSNWGSQSVDLAAPGNVIYSTLIDGAYGLYDDFPHGAHGSGTSFAAPYVAGVLALLLERSPGLTTAEIKARLLGSVDPLPTLGGLVLSDGRLNAFLSLADADITPPAAITDLSVVETASNWVVLQWTATGDDGHIGQASAYEIRHATYPLTEANFATATLLESPPDPRPAGSVEVVTVGPLAQSTTYHFAGRVLDEWGAYGEPGNFSLLSNVISTTTLGPPQLVVAPVTLAVVVDQDSTGIAKLTISNPGAGTLDFSLQAAAGSDWLVPRPAAGSLAGGESLDVAVSFMAAGLACGEHASELLILSNDPVLPELVVPAEIEVVGPPDVEVNGSVLVLGSAVSGSTVADTLWIANVGCEMLELSGPLTDEAAFSVPEPSAFALAPGESRPLVVEFSPRRLGTYAGRLGFFSNDPDEPVTVVALSGEGVTPPRIEVAPDSLYRELLTGALASQELTIRNTGGFRLDFSISLEPLVNWLAPQPRSGEIMPADSLAITVVFRPLQLCGDTYTTTLVITSSDPVNNTVAVPATMNVLGASQIAYSPYELDFGNVAVGNPYGRVMSLFVTNAGCEEHILNVSEVSIARPQFTTNQTGFSLAPGETQEVSIRFIPTSAVDYFARLNLVSDDPDQPRVFVNLYGTGIVQATGPDRDVPENGAGPLGNAPNPFNPRTDLRFDLPRQGTVLVNVYDLRGRLVRQLDGGVRPAGAGTITWHGCNRAGEAVASGVYFYRLYLDGKPLGGPRRMMLLK